MKCITIEDGSPTVSNLFITMKLILSLTLIWALSSTAGALQCLTCADPRCSNTTSVSCSSETTCVTASIQTTVSLGPIRQIFKECAPPSLCSSTGPQTFSGNFGGITVAAAATCCNTDNCNNETLPFPEIQPTNNLTCFTCDSSNSSQCNSTVQCRGEENRCIQANLSSGPIPGTFFGCASANLCAAASDLPLVGNTNVSASCCATNLCNPAQTTTTTTPSPTTASGDANSIKAIMINLLLGLFIFTLY